MESITGDVLRLNRPTVELAGIEPQSSAAVRGTLTILVIEERALYRDCLVQTLGNLPDLKVLSASSVEAWMQQPDGERVSLILLCARHNSNNSTIGSELAVLAQSTSNAAVVVVSDLNGVDSVVGAIANGARGFITTDTDFEVAVGALKMVSSGGTYVPASSLMAAHKEKTGATVRGPQHASAIFTSRQIAVIEALRKGKANKTIAYELNMCESTVKVHVRNIMKRLKAKNRTQVAYFAGELFVSEELALTAGSRRF